MNQIKQIEVLEQATNNILKMKAQLRQQEFSMITAVLRQFGGSINISGGKYRGAAICDGHRWFNVDEVILESDTNFEVWFMEEKTGRMFDLDEITAFQTCIFNKNDEEELREYSRDEFIYFLDDYMLSFLKSMKAIDEAQEELEAND